MANITGTTGDDMLVSSGSGTDIVHALAGDDVITFGADFDAADQIYGGPGHDELDISGDHSGVNAVICNATTFQKIELIVCAGNGYDITEHDANVAPGKYLTVDDTAGVLGTGGLRFNGAAETDGAFVLLGGGSFDSLTGSQNGDLIKGGKSQDDLHGLGGDDLLQGNLGNDILEGGAGADDLTGGAGHDKYLYGPVLDSTSIGFDTVHGFNFNAIDTFDMPGSVTETDTTIASGFLDGSSFDNDMAAAVNSATLAVSHAVLFTPNTGSFAGHTFLIVEANGVAGYQAGGDFVMDLVAPQNLAQFDAADFI